MLNDCNWKIHEGGGEGGGEGGELGIVGNVKEPLSVRPRLEEKGNGRKLAVMIGGSQMGRIAGEMQRIGGELVGVHKMYKVTGEWTEEEGGEGKE